MGSRVDWDNLSGDEQKGKVTSFDMCEAQCRRDPECLQYSYVPSEEEGLGKCLTSHSPRLGVKKAKVQSGWMVYRINSTMSAMGVCDEAIWG